MCVFVVFSGFILFLFLLFLFLSFFLPLRSLSIGDGKREEKKEKKRKKGEERRRKDGEPDGERPECDGEKRLSSAISLVRSNIHDTYSITLLYAQYA